MAYIVMAYVGMAFVGMAYLIMTRTVLACIVLANVVMAHGKQNRYVFLFRMAGKELGETGCGFGDGISGFFKIWVVRRLGILIIITNMLGLGPYGRRVGDRT